MTRGQFLAFLRRCNISLELDPDGDLTIEASGAVLTPDIIEEVKRRKAELVDYLREVGSAGALKIGRTAEAPSYPLSSSQMRLWLSYRINPDSTAYNVPDTIEWKGLLDPEKFGSAIQAVIQRHEVLRTIFKEDEQGFVRQWILPAPAPGFLPPYFDIHAESGQKERMDEMIREDLRRPFDLENGPLLRMMLFRLGEQEYLFYFNMHHIISDGWSMNLLFRDVMSFYEAFQTGRQPYLPELDMQYRDYARWEQEQLQTGQMASHQEFWNRQFSGNLPVLDLPMAKMRPPVLTQNGRVFLLVIDRETTRSIRSLCRQHNCTLFMGLLGVLVTLLHRYTGQEDIIIGTPVAGRDHVQLQDQIGVYINTLALRVQFRGENSFATLLENIRTVTLSAYEHQAYPFNHLIGELDLKRDASRSPLFDIMIALQNQQENSLRKERDPASIQEAVVIDEGITAVKFDLPFNFEEVGDCLNMRVGFNTDIYDGDSIAGLMRHYRHLLRQVTARPDRAIDRIDYLAGEEREMVVNGFNATAAPYPADRTITDLFRDHVVRSPEHAALVFQEDRISYGELDRRSTRLALYLQKKGVREGSLIPVCTGRSPEMIIAFLGILKAGGAYVPVDPTYPAERVSYMLSDTGAPLVIAVSRYRRLLEDSGATGGIYLDEEWDRIEEQQGGREPALVKPDSLAYVIYTSGSTGRPKGVMIEHTAIVNLICWHMWRYDVHAGCRSTVMAGVGFDACALETWSALLSGSTLYIITDDVKLDSLRLVDVYARHDITHAFVPPALIPDLVSASRGRNLSLRYVLIGGDRLQPADITGLSFVLVNQYGPTESTVMVTDYPIRRNMGTGYPIGKPIWNTRLYILDHNKNPVPVGVSGELYIGGIQLARGYLNNPSLTAERFIADPFHEKSGMRLYRTGDVARWLPDGNIDYIGRIDEQVKIRGHRIELSEIEHALLKTEGIDMAIARAIPGQHGTDFLAAYIVSKKAQSSQDLRRQLSKTLPEYMVPACFIQMPNFPLTSNGKIDRKLLPVPDAPGIRNETPYVAPRSEIDAQLARVMATVLNKPVGEIGIEDNFFDLGATSLTLMRAVRLINKEFEKDFKIVMLFRYPNIRWLADACFNETASAGPLQEEAAAEGTLDDILELFSE